MLGGQAILQMQGFLLLPLKQLILGTVQARALGWPDAAGRDLWSCGSQQSPSRFAMVQ